MSISCDKDDLLENAKCLQQCTLPGMREAIKVWLLTQIAGVSDDPDFLIEQSKCLNQCVPPKTLKAIETWLLCQIVNNCGGGGGGGGPFTVSGTTDASFYAVNDFSVLDDVPGLASLVYNFPAAVSFNFGSLNDLTSFSAPSLSVSDLTLLYFDTIPKLESISAPLLVGNPDIYINSCQLLTSVDFSALASCKFLTLNVTGLASASFNLLTTGEISVTSNPSLVSLSLPVFLPINGTNFNCSNNALNQASVDNVLHRAVANAGYVIGTVSLDGGTNSAPSAAGLLDKATLVGRGVTVTNN